MSAGAGAKATVAPPTPRTIDLRPLFAPRSIAVVGASPRSGIAKIVQHNLTVMKSATRCHFVNPRYDELYDQPCYPSLDALPEVPDTVLVALNPLRAAAVTEEADAVGIAVTPDTDSVDAVTVAADPDAVVEGRGAVVGPEQGLLGGQ